MSIGVRSLIARTATSVPSGAARRLAALSAVDAVGSGAFLAASVTIYVERVSVPLREVGFGLSLAGVAALVSGVWLGHLADRWGPRRMLMALNLLLAAAFTVFPAVRGFWGFLLVIALISMAQSGVNPARSALTYHLLDEEARVPLQALQRSVFNLGFAAGTAVAGIALEWGEERGFLFLIGANVLSYLVGAGLVWRLPDPGRTPEAARRHGVVRAALGDLPFLRFVGLSTVLMLSESVFYVGFPLWIISVAHAPRGLSAALILINTVIVVLFQVRVSRGSDRPGGAARLVRRALAAMSAAGLIMAVCDGVRGAWAVVPLVVAAVLVTLAEMCNSAAGWRVVFTYPPAEHQGLYQGIYGLGVSGQMIVGPTLVGSLLIPSGGVGWLVSGVAVLILLPFASRLVSHVSDHRSTVPAEAELVN